MQQEDIDRVQEFRKCVECFLCQDVCHVLRDHRKHDEYWPEIRVEVQGHTDSTGSNAHNQGLSNRRAESVRAYLVSKGISASRLEAKGYGEESPIADNTTKAGKQKNRRVELHKID
jgi:outer membrane protein OmpA-like peptidoglycan-associated protein